MTEPTTVEKTTSRRDNLRALLSSSRFKRLVTMVAGCLVLSLLFVVSISPTRYQLRLGTVPRQTIAATRDVVDTMATDRARELAAATVQPAYHFQDGVTEQVLRSLEQLQISLANVREYGKTLTKEDADHSFTDEEIRYAIDMVTDIKLAPYQVVTLLTTDDTSYQSSMEALTSAVKNAMQSTVSEGQESQAIDNIIKIIGFKTGVSFLQNIAQPVLRAVVQPNMVIDQQSTERARKEAQDAVEPVVIKQGQNILVRGEGWVTERQLNILRDLDLLSDGGSDLPYLLGAFLLSFLTLFAFCLALCHVDDAACSSQRQLLLLFSIMTVIMIIGVLLKAGRLMFLYPTALPGILLVLTMGLKPALIGNALLAALGTFWALGDGNAIGPPAIVFFLSSLTAGSLSAGLLVKNTQRARVLVISLVMGLVNAAIFPAVKLIVGQGHDLVLADVAQYALAGVSTALLSLALLPILESVFNLPTMTRLLELSNPNAPLLRRLSMEAPGTYHHSLIIANLAEAAAEAAGANPLLARIGGFYHDIGKLKRPLYFKENQIGQENIHDSLSPQESAHFITAHVKDGLAMAKQYRLPQAVQQIIAEHHGGSRVSYFYAKALRQSPEQKPDEKDYRYDGQPPSSAEGAIVMICDIIEAAIRSLNSPTPDEVQAFIDKLIRDKIDQGQLINAPLTLRQLSLVRDACARSIYGVFHERIDYPTAEGGGFSIKKFGSPVAIAALLKDKETNNVPGIGFSNPVDQTQAASQDYIHSPVLPQDKPHALRPEQFGSKEPVAPVYPEAFVKCSGQKKATDDDDDTVSGLDADD